MVANTLLGSPATITGVDKMYKMVKTGCFRRKRVMNLLIVVVGIWLAGII